MYSAYDPFTELTEFRVECEELGKVASFKIEYPKVEEVGLVMRNYAGYVERRLNNR